MTTIEKIKAGWKAFSNGKPVEQLTVFNANMDGYPILGVVGGNLKSWTKNGSFCANRSGIALKTIFLTSGKWYKNKTMKESTVWLMIQVIILAVADSGMEKTVALGVCFVMFILSKSQESTTKNE